jgi:hypothetical protein
MPARSVQSHRRPHSTAVRPRSSRKPRRQGPRRQPPLPAPVSGVLARLGRALAAGDLPTVALCFSYPSLLLTGADTHEFRDPLQVQTVFRESLQGRRGGEPAVERADDLGHGIFGVTVRWPASGGRAHYVIQESTVGTALIRVAVSAQD